MTLMPALSPASGAVRLLPLLLFPLLLSPPPSAVLVAQSPDLTQEPQGEEPALSAPAMPADGELQVDPRTRSIRFLASAQGRAFLNSVPPDHQYHALVSDSGSAVAKALFVTRASDQEIARVLREMGAEDGGGVPLAAWNLRWVPLVPQPATRVEGSPIQVSVTWEGAPREYDLYELLRDPGGQGISMRFGGNEAHDHEWDSGCIMCLFSCPGGVISNASYSIRDHQRGATSFEPSDDFPPDGSEVVITLTLGPSG
jgi:hypothetical protein